jgi:hypothetical protein
MLNDISVRRPIQNLPPMDSREGAKLGIQALMQDKDFGKRVLDNPGGSEPRVLDYLQHIAAGMTPESTSQRQPTDQEKALAGLEPPASPRDYDLQYAFNGRPKTEEQIALDTQLRGWLHEGGASVPDGYALGMGVDFALRTYGAMDGDQLDRQAADCRAELEREYGNSLPAKS